MPTANPYLYFNGNCREAFEFYRSVFGGEFGYVGTFGDMPQDPAYSIPDSEKEKIMHISLSLTGDSVLMGNDILEGIQPHRAGNNFAISISTSSREESDRIFNSLAEEGKVSQQMADTFWGSYFGTLEDRFGIQWMVSYSDPTKNPHG